MTTRSFHPVWGPAPNPAGTFALAEAFQRGRLPREQWTHEAHLLIASWFLWNAPLPQAVSAMRKAIIVYNHRKGIGKGGEGAYHETLTLFWMRVVDFFQHQVAGREKPFGEVCAALLGSGFADENLPLVCYSRARLHSSEARAFWLEPDLMSLHKMLEHEKSQYGRSAVMHWGSERE